MNVPMFIFLVLAVDGRQGWATFAYQGHIYDICLVDLRGRARNSEGLTSVLLQIVVQNYFEKSLLYGTRGSIESNPRVKLAEMVLVNGSLRTCLWASFGPRAGGCQAPL